MRNILSPISSDVLAFCFDSLSSPMIRLKFRDRNIVGDHTLGWGVSWFPQDSRAAIVIKDPSAREANAFIEATKDWENFRSTHFMCKVRGAARGYTHLETQPFVRTFAAQDWMFLHNGDLDRQGIAHLHTNRSIFLEPLGSTDSELMFSTLLGHISDLGARSLTAIDPVVLHQWLKAFDDFGSADCVLSDGQTMMVYFGQNSSSSLYWRRMHPPHSLAIISGEAADFAIDNPRDMFRTLIAFSSDPFDKKDWSQFEPGQLILARSGAIVFNSHPVEHLNSPRPAPVITRNTQKPAQKDPAFSAQQNQMQQYQTPKPGEFAKVVILDAKGLTHTADGRELNSRMYEIVHSTDYRYETPVEHSTHQFRLTPVEDPLQQVLQAELSVSIDGDIMRFEDVFGNQAIHYSITKPYQRLRLISKLKVRLFAATPDDLTSALRQHYLPMNMMPWQKRMLDPYLTPLELPETQITELLSYALSFSVRNSRSVLDTLTDMNQTIYRDYSYVQGVTTLATTPFDVYASRQGVCQDFANLFICLARLLGLPARYRVGYIFTGAKVANQAQSEATHAWAEVYIPYLGWRGYDPTNGCLVAQEHIRLGCGRHYVDATPTTGTLYRGGGRENLRVDVRLYELTP